MVLLNNTTNSCGAPSRAILTLYDYSTTMLCRLRQDLTMDEFVTALNDDERGVFISTMTRIRHLLSVHDHCTLYHPSFAHFLAAKTAVVACDVHSRLGVFCRSTDTIAYCVRNRTYHLLHGLASDRAAGDRFLRSGPGLTVVSLMGLCQICCCRTSRQSLPWPAKMARRQRQSVSCCSTIVSHFVTTPFFAHSAKHVAEALIVIGRPREALTHVLRHDVFDSGRTGLR